MPTADRTRNTRTYAIGTTWPGRDDIYAGIARGVDGGRDYHLFLVKDEPADRMSWSEAGEWAKSLPGEASLPSRSEQALLYANLKDQVKPAWHWSGTQSAGNVDSAWYQSFFNGTQGTSHKAVELFVRAVRRLTIADCGGL